MGDMWARVSCGRYHAQGARDHVQETTTVSSCLAALKKSVDAITMRATSRPRAHGGRAGPPVDTTTRNEDPHDADSIAGESIDNRIRPR